MKVIKICTIIIALLPLASLAQDFTHTHLFYDSTIQGQQNIHILEFELIKLGENLIIDMVSSDSILYPISYFADSNEAIAAIKSSKEYLTSNNEEWVFTAGPMLLQNGNKSDLLEGSFITKKHPRTALCLKENSILLITVDGRHDQAKGASLPELQNFLLSLKCKDAMNLDGGGSTTLWMNTKDHKGVVNCPSDNKKFDNKGERKVANIILIRKAQ